jgi:hypothetical protein
LLVERAEAALERLLAHVASHRARLDGEAGCRNQNDAIAAAFHPNTLALRKLENLGPAPGAADPASPGTRELGAEIVDRLELSFGLEESVSIGGEPELPLKLDAKSIEHQLRVAR